GHLTATPGFNGWTVLLPSSAPGMLEVFDAGGRLLLREQTQGARHAIKGALPANGVLQFVWTSEGVRAVGRAVSVE
ncbi:MAG: hypothetical protein JNL05_15015, partial [Flavobacteriales bacterium]|nr:hypothetical protein [Flavobacteriales bacterium]